MSQPLDLRKSIVIIRRLRVIVVLAAAFGLLVGAASGYLNRQGLAARRSSRFPTRCGARRPRR